MTPDYIKSSDTRIAKAIRSILTEEEYNLKSEGNMFGRKGKEAMGSQRKFRFHMLGLVHLPCSQKYLSCAFTQKNHKLARMLLSLGHEIFYYGSEGSDVPCTKFIKTHTLKDICADYGDGDNRFEIGYDWMNTDFRHDFNTARKPSTLKFNANTIKAINEMKKPDDFLLMTQGYYQKPIADAVKLFMTCEPGIGYRGSIGGNYRAFESSYIQNFTYGSQAPFECINGSYYDRVIPNYFDPDDMEFSKDKKDYYFFIGRMIKRKGILTAYLATKAIGAKLIIAGQGGVVLADGTLTATSTPDFSIPKGNWEYVGFVSGQKRKDLFKHAIATFTPTEYLECFAGTHIESMLHGTPSITTDFGVFPGTVINGVNGIRCSTLQDFVNAAKETKKFNPKTVRESAERYLMDNVKWEYQKWFDDIYCVWESATDSTKKGWHRIEG
jgi:glycosyltransferase involved in cell wall biosynthesis